MPWLSTPCRSAHERMSEVISALSSGIPQASRIAFNWARCVSHTVAGIGFLRLAATLRDPGVPARVTRHRERRPVMADGQALLKARFGIGPAGRRGAGRHRAAARPSRGAPLHRSGGARFPAGRAARRRAVGAREIGPATIFRRRDARPRRASSRSPTGSARWTGSPPRPCSWCGAATCAAASSLCELHDMPHANNNLDTFLNTAVDCSLAMAQFMAAAEAVGLGTCPIILCPQSISSACRRCLACPPASIRWPGLTVGWPVFRRPVSMRLPPSVVVHRERYDDSALSAMSRPTTSAAARASRRRQAA